jgi:hypothetical protein
MARLTLNPDPTFKAKVAVPVPGGTADVECVFKYRDRKALDAWIDTTREAGEVDVMLDMLAGWDLDDPCDRENVERLCNAYPGASREVTARYLRELAGIRQGN